MKNVLNAVQKAAAFGVEFGDLHIALSQGFLEFLTGGAWLLRHLVISGLLVRAVAQLAC